MLIAGVWFLHYPSWATFLGIAALILFTSPVIRAYLIADKLESNLHAAFGSYTPAGQPFSPMSLFKGSNEIRYQSIEYKKIAEQSLTIDFYKSQVAGKKPCVITIHGGSWSTGDSQQLPELNSYLAKLGYYVAALNYRKTPLYQNPAPVEDVKDVLAFLRSKANELQIDTNNFVLLGRSAGGQIALLAAYSLHDPAIKGVIDFYGPADMVWGYSVPSNPLVMDSRGVTERYLGGTYSKVPKNYEASSPILFVGPQSPPTLMIHGDNDVLVSPEHSRKLNEKLQQNGVKHYLLKLPWAVHGFDYNLNGPGGQLSTYAVTYFLKSVTN
ncbi:MAG TPA: alpha/beta hydrolase [Sphingobacteriaceae bacterium]|nr:alpha/beta hydrolase [Sphingobacteriaceae bacterium]